MAVRQVYFTEDQEALLVSLGISNLSAYVREKMEADARDRVTMAGRADELARKREVTNHPKGRRLRELLPPSFDDRAIADVLAKWPDSRPDLVRVLSEVGP